MKKLLLSLACVLGLSSIASAETVTITIKDLNLPNGDFTTTTYGGITLTANKGENKSNGPAFVEKFGDLRLYAKNTLTISAAKPITEISFDISEQGLKRLTGVTPSTGVFDEITTGSDPIVWKGNASEITFTVGEKAVYGSDGETKAGQLDFDALTITLAEVEGFVAAPTFSPNGGMVMPYSEVTISCATEGAKIYYTTDETEPTNASTEYTEPITIEDYTVIKAIAYTDDTHFSAVSEAAFETIPVIESIESVSGLEDGTPFIMGMNAVVAYCKDASTYITDGYNYALIYDSSKKVSFQPGDMIMGGWTGKVKDYEGLTELVPDDPTALELDGRSAAPQPRDIEPDMVSMMLIPSCQNMYLKLLNVNLAITTDENDKNIYTYSVGEGEDAVEISLYNKFDITLPSAEGVYDITGFVNVYKGKVQFYPTVIEEHADETHELYVIGDFQGWNLEKAVAFEYNEENGNYTVSIEDASEIRISSVVTSSADFDENCIFPDGELELNEWVDITVGENNSKIVLPKKGNYTIIVNEYNEVMKISESAGVSTIVVDAAAPAVYYNLQGIRVANPENGVFIVRQGSKVSKVVIR